MSNGLRFVCLMKESVARQHELKWHEDNSSILGFGATAITVVKGKLTFTAQVVVRDRSLSRNFLIRRSWCESPEISFMKYNKTLKFYYFTDFLFQKLIS